MPRPTFPFRSPPITTARKDICFPPAATRVTRARSMSFTSKSSLGRWNRDWYLRCCCCCNGIVLKLQTFFTSTLGELLDVAVVFVSAPIKHDLGYLLFFRELSHGCSRFFGVFQSNFHESQGFPFLVIHELRLKVLIRTEHHQAGKLCGSPYLGAHAPVSSLSLGVSFLHARTKHPTTTKTQARARQDTGNRKASPLGGVPFE